MFNDYDPLHRELSLKFADPLGLGRRVFFVLIDRETSTYDVMTFKGWEGFKSEDIRVNGVFKKVQKRSRY